MTAPPVIASNGELPPDSLLGPYRVVRVLGKGGMGVVYEAVHTAIQRRVAVKVLRGELASDKARAARFINEARAVNLVEHPGAVQVVDMGEQADGAPYIVMEFLRGETLSAVLKRSAAPLPWRLVVQHAQQILDILRAAHQKNIVHRDLKPDNVMIVADPNAEGGERVKLLDFGIAKLLDEVNASHFKTKTGTLMGSPAYMSPEQCKGSERITVQSDLYSLGVLMFELLSAQLPHVADGPGHMVVLHMFGVPRPLRELRKGLPSDLYALVDDLLQKAPEMRPTGAHAAERLQHLLRSSGRACEQVKTWAFGLALGLGLTATLGTTWVKVQTGRWWWQPGPARPSVKSSDVKPMAVESMHRPPRLDAVPNRPDMSDLVPSVRPVRTPTPRRADPGEATFAPVDVSKDRQSAPLPIKPVR